MLTAFRAAEDVTAGGRYVHGLTHLRFIYLNTEKKGNWDYTMDGGTVCAASITFS